jgi:uncharacterized cysteine cluster protein YcgN (CxxCxxCC family)
MSTLNFWMIKKLDEMTPKEWESLCDRCGRCCLHKVEDEDTRAVLTTDVACRLLDLDTCLCKHYTHRRRHVRGCVKLSPARMHEFKWLPSTCAYRLLAAGKSLPPWHPLITKDPTTVHRAGISVRHRALPETQVTDIESHVIDWPDQV